MKKIAIGSDHGGFLLKEFLRCRLKATGRQVVDFGCSSPDPVEYPEIAFALAKAVAAHPEEYDFGILCCGTGIGVSIAANKVKGIRAALCADCFSARMAREHNNANIITLGGRTTGTELAWEMVTAFLGATFQHGIHEPRVEALTKA